MIDCADPGALARWWLPSTASTSSPTTAGSPWRACLACRFRRWTSFRCPSLKTVKNRVHWDVTAPEVAALVAAGATLLRERGGDIHWHVLADPEGNEFCVFTDD